MIAAFLVSCSAPSADVRSASAARLPDCPLDNIAALELEALDDAPPRASSFVEVAIDRPGDVPTLPSDVSAFIARGRTREGSIGALGLFPVRDGSAHGPLFRAGTACAMRLMNGDRASFPRLLSPTVATSSRFALLAGGRDADGTARSDAIVLDTDAGVATRVGLRRRRLGAASAIIDARAIVAGGAAGAELWEDAEIVALDRGEVLAEPVRLAEKRADAAAVTLSTGEVLLVGGRGPSGALRTIEAIDPGKPIARTIDLATLSRARRSPTAVRLVTGEIVVMGGTDDASAPVDDIEVFDARASQRLRTLPWRARSSVSAVALPSGAALVISSDELSSEALLVRSDGIELLPAIARGGRLVAATDGAPFLYDGAFRRFDPFAGTFAELTTPPNLTSDDTIPPFGLAHGVLGVARVEDDALVIRALRYDVRPPLVVDPGTLGLGSTAHLSPDRMGVASTREGLEIPPRARVAVTDATYLGLSLRLNASGRDRPSVELRDEHDALLALIGDTGTCAWPAGDSTTTEIVRERDGALLVRVGTSERRCGPTGTGRITVTLIAGTAEARVRGVTLTRR